MRSILAGLDDSPYRANVVELGLRWAARFDALLVGLGIVDKPSICRPEPVPPGGGAFKQQADAECLAAAREKVAGWLDAFAQRAKAAGVAYETCEREDRPEKVIRQVAQCHDLILLGHRTYFRFATQEGPCDTLEEVLHNTPRPIVTVPEHLPESDDVVIAYDGSLQVARAVQQFVHLGLAQSARVHVASVASTTEEAEQTMACVCEYLSHHKIAVERHALVNEGGVAKTLLEAAGQCNAGLLVLGAYGRSTLHDFFLGSVTKKILHTADIPLFVYH